MSDKKISINRLNLNARKYSYFLFSLSIYALFLFTYLTQKISEILFFVYTNTDNRSLNKKPTCHIYQIDSVILSFFISRRIEKPIIWISNRARKKMSVLMQHDTFVRLYRFDLMKYILICIQFQTRKNCWNFYWGKNKLKKNTTNSANGPLVEHVFEVFFLFPMLNQKWHHILCNWAWSFELWIC